MKKMSGEMTLTQLLILLIVVVGIVSIGNRIFRPELYDEKNDFRGWKVENNQVVAQIQDMNWYDNDDSTSYYIFTDIGKLYVLNEGFLSFNESLYDNFEDQLGANCTLYVKDTFLHTTFRDFLNRNSHYIKLNSFDLYYILEKIKINLLILSFLFVLKIKY